MRLSLQIIILVFLAWLAFQAWQPPESLPEQRAIHAALPKQEIIKEQPILWYVVTRRLVWEQAAQALKKRLQNEGFKPIPINRKEPVSMHAFDDGRIFKTREAAEKAKKAWQQHKIEANIIQTSIELNKDIFIVGLGRFFLTSYAEQMQERLKRIKKPYRYERREVTIPTYRFTFAPAEKQQTRRLWQQIRDMGIADPVMMKASRFKALYGPKRKS
ncbi:MAG: hypothetical protein ACE5F3_02050 [Mariprofundaceae bacterium]